GGSGILREEFRIQGLACLTVGILIHWYADIRFWEQKKVTVINGREISLRRQVRQKLSKNRRGL
ncbi:MAG: hypothetical protein PHY56_04570, partial [Candidatus Omnitrophica bacterium]|nr:hypothetical protein [Candidatus Omnitrophota bacterium]